MLAGASLYVAVVRIIPNIFFHSQGGEQTFQTHYTFFKKLTASLILLAMYITLYDHTIPCSNQSEGNTLVQSGSCFPGGGGGGGGGIGY